MSRRAHALAVFFVALLVVAACGTSIADAADATTHPCGPEKGWGPAKADTSASAKPLLGVPAIPVAFVDVSQPAPRSVAVEDAALVPSRLVLVQPLAPRAPPLV